MDVCLVTEKSKSYLKIGDAINYKKNSSLLFTCRNCCDKITINILKKKGTEDKSIDFSLIYPNRQNYTQQLIKKFASIFEVVESTLPNTKKQVFKIKSPHGNQEVGVIKLISCDRCREKYAICMSFYGDYSRYPGTNLHLIGIKKISDSLFCSVTEQNNS